MLTMYHSGRSGLRHDEFEKTLLFLTSSSLARRAERSALAALIWLQARFSFSVSVNLMLIPGPQSLLCCLWSRVKAYLFQAGQFSCCDWRIPESPLHACCHVKPSQKNRNTWIALVQELPSAGTEPVWEQAQAPTDYSFTLRLNMQSELEIIRKIPWLDQSCSTPTGLSVCLQWLGQWQLVMISDLNLSIIRYDELWAQNNEMCQNSEIKTSW